MKFIENISQVQNELAGHNLSNYAFIHFSNSIPIPINWCNKT